MADLVAKAVITGDSSGLVGAADVGSAALDKVTAAAGRAGAAGAEMAAGMDTGTAAMIAQANASAANDNAAAAMIVRLQQQAQSATSITGRLDALAAAQAEYTRTVTQANGFLSAGTISQAEHNAVLDAAAAKLAFAKAANDSMTAAMVKELAAATAFGEGVKALGVAEEAAAVNTAALERGIHAMALQAGIGRESLMEVKAALDLLKDHPAITAIAAITGLMIAGVLAVDNYDTAFRRVEGTATSLGNVFNLDREQLSKYADQIAATAGVSVVSATKMESSFLTAGLSPDRWNAATQAAVLYAKKLETDVPTAAEKLAAALKDPKGAGEELLTTLGNLDPQIRKLIEDLVVRGDNDQAVDKILDRVIQRLHDMPDTASGLSKMFHQMGTDTSTMFTNIGGWLKAITNFEPPAWLLFLARAANAAGALATSGPEAAAAVLGAPGAPPPSDRVDLDIGPPAPTPLELRRDQLAKTTENYGVDTYQKQIDQLKAERAAVQDYMGVLQQFDGTQDLIAAQQTKLTNIGNELKKAYKDQHDALLNLDETAKQHEEQVKEALKDGERMVASAALEAAAQGNIATATLHGAAALQKANDQTAIDKATLPLVTAQRWAHGAAWQALQKDIDAVTESMKKEQAAQHAAAAITDVRGGVAGLTGDVFGAPDIDGLSASYAKSIKDAIEWRDQTVAAMKAAGVYSDEMATDVQLEFRDKLSKAYTDAVTAIRGAIMSLTDNSGASGFALMYQEDVRAAQNWRTQMVAQLNGAREAIDAYVDNSGGNLNQYDALLKKLFGDDYRDHLQDALTALNTYADQVQLIYNDKLAKAYQDDLNRRTDWAAGVERANIAITKDTDNMAKASETAVKGFSDEAEKDFTDLNMTGQERVESLVEYIIQQFLKLAYLKFLAPSINSLGSSIFDEIGSILGLGGDGGLTTTGSGNFVGVDTLPGFADGTDSAPGGPARINEQGGEIVELPGGSKVMTHQASMDYLDRLYDRPMLVQTAPAPQEAAPMIVNITNNAHAKVTAQQSTGPNGQPQLNVLVDQIDNEFANRSRNGRLALTRSLETTHSLRRGTQL